MLWYLHLASEAGLCIQAYQDQSIAQGETLANGASRFVAATLTAKPALPAAMIPAVPICCATAFQRGALSPVLLIFRSLTGRNISFHSRLLLALLGQRS